MALTGKPAVVNEVCGSAYLK
ncbi:hypothetical protein F383_37067 [Gossypium arboreum]|uniref:Uncharacterized protein n=1 Tax=Gossypium arboreum TaxID=29729 RepID=A0A0B0MFB9_GOSAR|nr:hypothetical protein F383_37067 [Gossypium arboreum]